MPCFASSLLDSNRRQRALQILNGPTGQEIKILVETAWFMAMGWMSKIVIKCTFLYNENISSAFFEALGGYL